MNGHPALAAEINRRRAAYANPQAFAPAPEAPAPTPGQYEQAQGYGGWETSAPGQPTEPVSGQTYSPEMYAAGQQVAANPAIDPTPAEEPQQAVTAVYEPVQPAEAAPAEGVEAPTQFLGENVPVEVTGGETADVLTSAQPEVVTPDQVHAPTGPAVAPEQQAAYDDLVRRSQVRAEAAEQVTAVDAALVAAVRGAVEAAGFQAGEAGEGDATHELRFTGGAGETMTVSLGRLSGDAPDELSAAGVPLTVRCQSSSYGGSLDSGTGRHGEVVVVADEWSGQATSIVSLTLSLSDYLGADRSVDQAAVGRDVGAVVAVVRQRLA